MAAARFRVYDYRPFIVVLDTECVTFSTDEGDLFRVYIVEHFAPKEWLIEGVSSRPTATRRKSFPILIEQHDHLSTSAIMRMITLFFARCWPQADFIASRLLYILAEPQPGVIEVVSDEGEHDVLDLVLSPAGRPVIH